MATKTTRATNESDADDDKDDKVGLDAEFDECDEYDKYNEIIMKQILLLNVVLRILLDVGWCGVVLCGVVRRAAADVFVCLFSFVFVCC